MSQWKKVAAKNGFEFHNGKVQLAWSKTGDQMNFAGIYQGAGAKRKGFSFGPGSTLWKVELRDRQGYATFLSGAQAQAFSAETGQTLVLRWSKLAGGKVDVIARVQADPDQPVTRWRFEVVNRSQDHTVWAINFPAVTDIVGPSGSHRDDFLITTDGFGSMIPDPIRQPRLTCWTNRGYPNGLQSMSLVALVNKGLGLYVGTHDKQASLQRFNYLPDKANDRLPLEVLVEPQDAGRRQPRVKLNYDTVLALFEGDWYEVAQLHRPWAIQQKWAKTPIAARKDIPDWAKELPLWVRFDMGNVANVTPDEIDRRGNVVAAFRKALGCDIGAHLYQWHDHPFDIDYPSYKPRKGIRKMVSSLQGQGVHVMPYINGRLFDMDNRDWEGEKAYRYATKGANPKLGSRGNRFFVETYGSMTPMAVMCAGTKYWQEKVAGICARLVKDLGVDGVYIDQVAAAWSEVCSDPTHGHPLRGGGWWIDGYQKMLDLTQAKIARLGKQVLLTTECNADAYMNMFGNLLMVHSVRNYVVPMFTAIYGGRAPMFARNADAKDGPAFRIIAAQNILWGCQTGWFALKDMELLLTPKYAKDLEFLKALCGLHAHLLPYTQAGTMLRPPAITGQKIVPVVWEFCGSWPEKVSTVWAVKWQLGTGQAIAVVNAHTQRQTITVDLDQKASARDTDMWWSGADQGTIKIAGQKATLDMPPLSVAMMWF